MSETGTVQNGSPDRDGKRSRPSWRVVTTITALAIALGIGVYLFMTQGPGIQIISPPGSTVAEFTGTDNQRTDSFQVREGWEIHWENTGERFAFAIAGDRDFGTVIEQREPGSGVTSPVGGGTFRLEITATGPWSIRIVQGE